MLPGASSPTPATTAWDLELRKGPYPAGPGLPPCRPSQLGRGGLERGRGLKPGPRSQDPSPEVSADPASASSGPGLAQVWTDVASAGNPLLRG